MRKTMSDREGLFKRTFAMFFYVCGKRIHPLHLKISARLSSPQHQQFFHFLVGLGGKFHQTRWILHRRSEQQKAHRITLSQDMLQMMKDLAPTQQIYLTMGDEIWIFWDNNHPVMWSQDRENRPANERTMIESKKTMLSVYFSRSGFASIEFLPQCPKYNSQAFTETILPSLVTRLPLCRSKLKAKTANLHGDKVKPHNARLFVRKMEEYGFIRML